jgi:hypothetical protein
MAEEYEPGQPFWAPQLFLDEPFASCSVGFKMASPMDALA